MGSLPRLPDKIKYKYRKGHTNEAQNCKACANFIKDFEVIDLLEMALSGSGAPDDVQAPMIAH